MQAGQHSETARRELMALLAEADSAALERGLAAAAGDAAFVDLRPPEVGLVMLRGRIGGTGAPFNVGEASVARAAVRLASGETGFSYMLGRDLKKARLAALCDALWQSESSRAGIERHVLAPLRAARDQKRQHERSRTAATKVDFFTLVRGEDNR